MLFTVLSLKISCIQDCGRRQTKGENDLTFHTDEGGNDLNSRTDEGRNDLTSPTQSDEGRNDLTSPKDHRGTSLPSQGL